MLTTTTTAPSPRGRRRISPTKAERRQWQRDDFARGLLPLLLELHRAGANTNRGLAEELNRRGVPTEHGGAWHVQTAAAVRYRLMMVLGEDVPQARVPPPRPRNRRKGRA